MSAGKTGIESIVSISEIIVYENESERPEILKTKGLFRGYGIGIKEIQIF